MSVVPIAVVSIPLVTHLREAGAGINDGAALRMVSTQASSMVDHLLVPLVALSGRFPRQLRVPDERLLECLRAARCRADLQATDHGHDAHWLWQYLNAGLDTTVMVVDRATVRAVLADRGATSIEDPTSPRRMTVQLASNVEKVLSFTEEDGIQVLTRDGRDSVKAEIWDAAAARGTRRRAAALGVGDSAPYYLAGWILGVTAAPGSLASADADKAQRLLPLIASHFAAAADEALHWRAQTAETLGIGLRETRVTARVRAALSACCYEALKIARSWVSLDRKAEDEKVARLVAFDQALAQVEPAPAAASIRDLLEIIEIRAKAHRVENAEATPLHAGSLTWKACAAIRSFMNSGPLVYPRGGVDHPWSHPDWEAFWNAVGGSASTRSALEMLVNTIATAGDEETSIAELYRAWYRAQGYARLTMPRVVRVHVDRSNSGANGTLESGVDASARTRARGVHANQPTAIIDATVNWLGRDHALRFHQGRNRALTLTNEKAAWGMVLERNVRTRNRLLGVCKAFDLSVRGDRVRIDLPIQVTLPAFAQVPLAKQLAIGGWYRSRPDNDPMSPGAAIAPPESATVLALDIGVNPIAGYAAISKDGDRFTEIASGHLGLIPKGKDPEIFVPGFHLQAAGVAISQAHTLKRYLRIALASDAPMHSVGVARTRLAASDSELATTADRLLGGTEVPSLLRVTAPKMLIELLTAVARMAASPVTKGHEVLIGSSRYAGLEIHASDHAALTARALQAACIVLPAGDRDLRQVVHALLRPLASMLLAYQRLRACRSDLGTVSKKHGYGDSDMNARRATIAQRHGYTSESHYWSIAHLGATNVHSLERGTDADHDQSLTTRILLADLWESVSDLGRSLAGWGRPALKHSESPAADDPRALWDASYGFLRTHAAAIRSCAHEGVAQRAVSLATVLGCSALAIERLHLGISSRVDADANTLARRMAASDWTAMLRRAADLGGVPVVQVDAWWTSREIAPLENGTVIARKMGVRIGSELHQLDSRAPPLPVRVNAARNIALRSLTGYPERARFPVILHQSDRGGIAALARPANSPTAWAVWQQRLARALGARDPGILRWKVDVAGVARLQQDVGTMIGAGTRSSLVANGSDEHGKSWLTREAFAAAEGEFRKRMPSAISG